MAIWVFFDKGIDSDESSFEAHPISDKPAHMGSLDCSHEFPGFPTFLSVGATKKRPCLCHVSTRTNTPGPPPLTQRQSPAAMARVFINPGHIQATKRNVARKPSFRGWGIYEKFYMGVYVFLEQFMYLCVYVRL